MFTRVLVFLAFFIRCFSFDILEKGVGPASYDPYLSFNDNQEALITWNIEGNVGGQIYYSFYDSSKRTFRECFPLDDGNGIHAQTSLNNHFNAVMVWDDLKGHIAYSTYDSDIKKFRSIKAIENSGVYGCFPFLKINENGEGLCVFFDTSMNVRYAFYNPIEKQFSSAFIIKNTQVGNSLKACFNDHGEGIIVWSDLLQNAIFYSFYNKILKMFSSPEQLNMSDNSANMVVELNNQGECIIAWNTGAKTSLVGSIVYTSYDKESKKFLPTEIIDKELHGYYPQVALNNNGDSLLSWSRLTSTGKKSLFYASYDKLERKYSSPKNIEKAGLYSTGCQLSLNDQNEAILTWFTTISGMIQYAIYDTEKQMFEEAQFVAEAGINSQYPQIKLNNNGEAIITWSVFGAIEYSFYDKVKKKFCNAKMICQKPSSQARAAVNKKGVS